MSNIMVEETKVLGPGYVIEFKYIYIYIYIYIYEFGINFFLKMAMNVARKESGNSLQV
jgi:hypothetical protein